MLQRQPLPILMLCWLQTATQQFPPDLPRSRSSNYFHLHQEKYFWSHEHRQHFKPNHQEGCSQRHLGHDNLITGTWEIASDSPALQGTERVSLVWGCHQGKGSISCCDTDCAETEAVEGRIVPSHTNLSPSKVD